MTVAAQQPPGVRCDLCGIPVDAEPFDVSGFLGDDALPQAGEEKVLASFQLHAQYCGILTSFAQFTDAFAEDNSRIQTPGYEWRILQNGKPLFPYNSLEMIVNPWGYNCFTFLVRLDENARVEMVVRNRGASQPPEIHAFAGRLIGRYWYNRAFGAEATRQPRRRRA